MRTNRIFISAGEVSGDIHAADLMQAIRAKKPDVRFRGLGGQKMLEAGLDSIAGDVSTMSSVGFAEAVRYISPKKKLMDLALSVIKKEEFDAVILVDNQGFNIPIAKAAKKSGVKTIYYFPPHVSIWGRWAAPTLARSTDLLIPSLPADNDVYIKYTNSSYFLGNPLIDKVRDSRTPASFFKKNSIDREKRTVSLFPGSRNQEIKTLLPVMLDAASVLAGRHGLQVILPVSHPEYDEPVRQAIEKRKLTGKVIAFSGNAYNAMSFSSVNIMASGTATLESVLFKRPCIICYKISGLTFFIGKHVVKNGMIGLPNIILNKKIMPELLQKDCNAANIVAETLRFLKMDDDKKKELAGHFKEIESRLGKYPVLEKIAGLILERIR